jgi:hypothetical protein
MNQKDHERICVERFLKAIGKVPTLIEDSEAPDFRVMLSGEIVGIEITKALRAGERGKNTPQAQASLRTRVLNQARDLYDATGAPPLHVSAAFLDHTPISGSRMAGLSREIAEFLHAVASGFALYERAMIEPWEHTDAMPEVYSLHVMRVPSPDHGFWGPNGVAMCRTADESDFEAALARKEKKLTSYRSALQTVWLVVVVELFEAGEIVSTPEPVAPFSITTAFDRVFAFHWLSGRVAEIAILRGEPID